MSDIEIDHGAGNLPLPPTTYDLDVAPSVPMLWVQLPHAYVSRCTQR